MYHKPVNLYVLSIHIHQTRATDGNIFIPARQPSRVFPAITRNSSGFLPLLPLVQDTVFAAVTASWVNLQWAAG
jgi:hypothetical protein